MLQSTNAEAKILGSQLFQGQPHRHAEIKLKSEFIFIYLFIERNLKWEKMKEILSLLHTDEILTWS